jgi:hypothetical protein
MTLAECLGADSPGEGLRIARKSLDEHRKAREKAAEARYKLQRRAPQAVE